ERFAGCGFIIEGHTDSIGSEEYNLNLSQRRADAVKKYLTSEFQLDENRLITKPYGKTIPIASNDNEDGRALNRRVEFVRIK
ncbi:MAG: OmpA family protein, partial [Desulfobacteraceae bacterium]|nr:OmpA family protein [Desulfobacteraceae bacterium]